MKKFKTSVIVNLTDKHSNFINTLTCKNSNGFSTYSIAKTIVKGNRHYDIVTSYSDNRCIGKTYTIWGGDLPDKYMTTYHSKYGKKYDSFVIEISE